MIDSSSSTVVVVVVVVVAAAALLWSISYPYPYSYHYSILLFADPVRRRYGEESSNGSDGCYVLFVMRHDPSSNITMLLLVGTITSHYCRWGSGNSIRRCCSSPSKMLLLLLLLLSMSMIMMIPLQYAVIEYLLLLGWLVCHSLFLYMSRSPSPSPSSVSTSHLALISKSFLLLLLIGVSAFHAIVNSYCHFCFWFYIHPYYRCRQSNTTTTTSSSIFFFLLLYPCRRYLHVDDDEYDCRHFFFFTDLSV